MYLKLVTFFLIVSIVSSDPISYTECDIETNIGKLDSLVVPGDPIVVGTSHPVDLSLSGSIDSAVNDDVDLVLKIEKQISVFGIKKWISVPCIDDYGSCTQKLIDYVTRYNETFVCKLLTQMGKPCSMPFLPGQYSVSNFIIPVNLSKIPQAILSLANGKIKVHLEIKNDSVLYCVDVVIDLDLESNTDDGKLIVDETNHSENDQQADDLSSQYGGWADFNPFWND